MKPRPHNWRKGQQAMKILVYGINYAPELTGIGKYTGEMCAWLAGQGHKVSVITALPYYPDWQIHQSYKSKWWFQEKLDGVDVIRCPLYVPRQVNSLKRIIHEFSFLAGIFPVWLMTFFKPKYDVVLCISPPFHLGILPLIYAKIRGAIFINHIQDLQVDAAKELGMIKNKLFLKMMFATEKAIFDQGANVSTISEGMQKKLLQKGVAASNLIFFPNWVDPHKVRPLSMDQSLRRQLGINASDKVILYSGNLGEKQGLEIIIEAANYFRAKKDIYFIISGSGGAKEKLMALAIKSDASNIRFCPLTPLDQLSALLAIADVHLILQKKTASDFVMPSKINGILAAAGCAVVTALPGTTLCEIFHRYQMGIVIEPESVEALCNGIETALTMDTTSLKLNARRYAEHHLSMHSIFRNFEQKLFTLAGRKTQIPVPVPMSVN